MATGMTDGTTIVWTLNTDGATQTLTLAGDSEVEDVAFTPDGRRLVTAAADGEVDVWDITPDWSPESVAVPGAQGVALSPDGTMLATSSTSEDPPQPWTTGPAAVHLWDTGTGRPVATLRGHSASLDGTARVWDARTGEPLLTLHDEVPGDPRATAFIVDVAFAPDGKTIATTASEGGRIRLWDAATGDLLRTMQDTSGAEVPGNWSVTFSPDGRLLAAPSDGTLFVWDTTDGSVVAHLEVPNVDHLAFTLDGRRLIGTSAGGLTVWNTRTWTVEDSAENASGEVAVSASGDVATLSPDGVVRLWQLEPLRERLVVATDLAEQGSHMLAFAPDGQRLAVSVDGIVSVYALDIDDLIRLARDRVTRGFTDQECRQYLHVDGCLSS
jgi:WD40 repeat protein